MWLGWWVVRVDEGRARWWVVRVGQGRVVRD